MSGRKRLEALSEILESEKSFVLDINNWTRRFRTLIMRSPNIDSRGKYKFCENVFVNLDDILVLHEEILKDLEHRTCVEARGEDACRNLDSGASPEEERTKFGLQDLIKQERYEGLEYHTIFSKYVNRFEIYENYVSKLPYAEKTLAKELHLNEGFRVLLQNFLREINSESLNYTHFMYRPSQKLTRYCILFQAVLKNETDEKYRKEMGEVLAQTEAMAKRVDKAYGSSKNFFRIFEISKCLRRGKLETETISLNLFSKRRRLIKEGDVVTRTDNFLIPRVLRVIVFDHLVIICDVVIQNTMELLYLNEVFPPYKFHVRSESIGDMSEGYTKGLFPLYFMARDTIRFLGMFFRSRQERDVWKNVLETATRICTKFYNRDIRITKLDHISSEEVLYSCEHFTPFRGAKLPKDDFSFFVETDEEEVPRTEETLAFPDEGSSGAPGEGEAQNIAIQEDDNSRQTFLQRLLFGGDMFGKKTWLQRIPDSPENRRIVLFTTRKGVYMRHNGKNSRIYSRMAKKIVFNGDLSLLVLQDGDRVLVSPFGAEATSLSLKILHLNAENFFYCENSSFRFIVVKTGGTRTFSMIYMYSVEEAKSNIRISMFRRLYVGSNVQNVKFFGKDIVVAAQVFDLINPDSLETAEIINPLDPYLPYYFLMCKETRARSILRVSQGYYLVCFDALGFIIDYYGRSAKSHIVFSWNCNPHDFKVFEYYLVVLGTGATSIFSLRTGALLFFDDRNTYHFCSGSNRLLMYDSHNFYRLVLPGLSGTPGDTDYDVPGSTKKAVDTLCVL